MSVADQSRLSELLALPPVCRFLNDGCPPPDAAVESWILEALRSESAFHGLWLLDTKDSLIGCARLSVPDDDVASAELTYVLHPDVWGQGLATRMAVSAIERAFQFGAESIMAGADVPNEASIRVMKRIGMRFLRATIYPAGPGVEYITTRATRPSSSLEPIPFVEEVGSGSTSLQV